MSDWGAVHDVTYFNAGLDQHSGAELDKQVWFDAPLQAEFAAGRVSRERLADAVHRILRSIYAVGADGLPTEKTAIDYAAHAQVAREAAAAGIVLLKNDGALPLVKSVRSIVVIGGYAIAGVMAGGGSSQVTPVGGPAAIIPMDMHRLVRRPVGQLIVPSSPVAALKAALPDTKISYDSGYDTAIAAARAASAEVALVFATKWETEGTDSSSLSLPGGQDALIAAVANANPRTIVVLETGNPVTMPWLADVKGVVEAWYPGQEGGRAIADVLVGAVNPSGRLPMTFPADDGQNPRAQLPGLGAPDGTEQAVDYPEGSDVGYRWFAANGQRPLFPFGHGLGYTRFEHEGLKLRGGDAVTVSFTVRNRGAREGADVPQVYLINAAGRRLQRLAGFARVSLRPGQRREVQLKVDPRLLADWDGNGWHIRGGTYGFALGKSAGDLGPVATVELDERRMKP
jgi:beta-glucosidase